MITFLTSFKPALSAVHLKRSQMSAVLIAITDWVSVGRVELHIHNESAWSVTGPIVSSQSRDCHKTSGSSEFNDTINNWSEYEMILSVLQLAALFSFSFSSLKWWSLIFLKQICVLCIDKRKISETEEELKMRSSVFSWRMKHSSRHHLSVLESASGVSKSYI